MRCLRVLSARLLSLLVVGTMLLNLAPLSVVPEQVVAAPGAPLLVLVDSTTSPYGAYLQELLNAEGVKDYEVLNLSALTSSALLTGRRAVLLGEANPSGAQITLLDNFVSAGGGLVAMRPSSGLNGLLGVSLLGTSTAEGYLRITDPALGAGLYANTMQYHGTASHYTLAGAAQVADLYSTRSVSAGRPAATLANRGSGKAAMFAYDLARSVALTRQGNPANADVDTDHDGVVRTIDLFYNWVDLERTSVPQADMQQRLLVRLIEAVSARPLPRLWYFPNAAPTVHIATADAHANPDSYYQTEIDALRQHNATATFYLSPAGNPASSTVANWRAQGFDFGPHPYVDCGYQCGFSNAFTWFQNTYGLIARTVRTHQVRWAGWTGGASVESQFGVAMDFNFYQWGPWLTNSSGPALGYMTGSGQPMRFVDASGTILPIYQQHTSLVDEELAPGIGVRGLTLAQALAASRQVIDDSVNGYYTPIATQYHVDYFYPDVSTWGMGTVDYALQRGAISLNSDSWLTFVQERAATTITNSTWTSTTLAFTVGAGGTGQTMLVPFRYGSGALTGVTVGGTPKSYTTMTINGTAYAAVPVQSGNYVATYAPDTTAPAVNGVAPAAGATDVSTSTPIATTFSEAMNRASAQAAFSLAPAAAGAFSWNSAGTTMTFTPGAPLAASSTYTATVAASATDLAGNPLPGPTTWSFTTAAVTPPPSVASVSPISGPVAGGTTVTIGGSGFSGATAVAFGGVAASNYTVNSATAIVATAPPHAAGTVDITVTTPVGTSAVGPADRFSYIGQSGTLAVAASDPATGSTSGGTTVRISGANFATGATVTVGGAAATGVTVTSTTTLTATVPAHAAGTVDIVVTNPNAQTATLTGGFTYIACPTACMAHTTVADFSTGTSGAGIAIVQTADGELSLAPAAGAEFSGSALPSGWSAAPWAAGGGATVAGGSLTVDGALVATNAYFGPGRVLEFVTTFDGSAPYQHLGLGTDLNSAPWAIFSTGSLGGALYARTNTGAGQTDTAISGNWVGTPHRFRIEWTATGIVYSIDNTQVAVHPLVISSSLRPVVSDGAVGSGNLQTDWLRLSPYAGSGVFTSRVFDAAGTAAWGAVAWTGSVPSGTSLSVSVRTGNTPTPDGTWTGFAQLVSGATVGGSARYLQYQVTLGTTNADLTPAFRDLAIGYTVSGPLAPTVSGITPATGQATGGTAVTITGTNFAAGATVTIGGVAASGVTVTNATTITATTPVHAVGAADVVVTNTDGRSGVLPGGFTYLAAPPAVTAVNPTSGSTSGGTTVTLAGTSFSGATAVAFGGVPAASFTVTSDTAITATAPAHAAGVVNVTVATPAGTSPAATGNEFTYLVIPPTPQVRRVTPGTGSAAGGATVSIEGISLSGATSVTFGGTAATFTVNSATSITATTPAHAAGAVDVRVTTGGGTSAINTAARYTYVQCPTACITQTTVAQFAGGTIGAGAYVAQDADGEVSLAPALGAEFGGGALPPELAATPWGTGGAGTVGGGALTVDGALVAATTYFTPGRALEFVATFGTGAPFQHAGLGIDLNNTPWAIFSTGSAGDALYARTNAAGGAIDTSLGAGWLGAPHRFRIEWTTTGITYLIDGTTVATHALGNTGDLRPVISDGPVGGATLSLDWLRLGPYAASGGFTSAVLDAGDAANWGTVAWSGETPAGSGVVVSVRAGNTPTPDATWSAFAPVANGGSSGASGRYAQYQVALTAGDPAQTPTLADLTIAYAAIIPPPTLTGLSPNGGLTTGGTSVVISGTGFTGATAVTFGGTAATSFTVNSATGITATAPAHAAGTIDVVVTAPGGTSAPSAASKYTYQLPPPTITGLSPAAGSTAGGTTVTVTGTGFLGATAVTFGGTAVASFTVVSDTSITAPAPAHVAGAVNVAVTAPGGTTAATAASQYTYQTPAPAVTGLAPTFGPVTGGTQVTISGTDFTGATAVAFGGTAAASFSVVSATSLTAVSPAGVGTVDVTVTTPAGTSAVSAADRFTYTPAPTITLVSPNSGSTAGGTAVTITGTNFLGGATVAFGGVAATNVVVVSATSITATTPARAAGAVAVTVANPDGQVGTLASGYTYRNAPTLGAISPTSGAITGNTLVTITGTNFVGGGTTVTFDGISGTNITVSSATQLTATTPAHAAGVVAVVVGTTGGTSAPGQFTYVPPPTITGLTPNAGPLAGGNSVTITGTNFTGTTRVRFGGTNATFTVVSDTTIAAIAPSRNNTGAVNVTVDTPYGSDTTSTAERYTYVAPPTVTGVGPASGPAAGGTTVTITGTNFTFVSAVTFGTVNATTFTVNSQTRITATAPAQAAGQVNIRVATAGGTSAAALANRFTYTVSGNAAPGVAALGPGSGVIAGRRRERPGEGAA